MKKYFLAIQIFLVSTVKRFTHPEKVHAILDRMDEHVRLASKGKRIKLHHRWNSRYISLLLNGTPFSGNL